MRIPTSTSLARRRGRPLAIAAGALLTAALAFAAQPAFAEVSSGSELDSKNDIRSEHPAWIKHNPTSDLRETTLTVRRNFVDLEFRFVKHVRATVNGVYADVYPDSADDDELFIAWSPDRPAGLYRIARNRDEQKLCSAEVDKQLGERGTLTVTIDRDCFTPSHAGDDRVRELTARRIAVEGYKDFKLKWRDYSTSVHAVV